MATKKKTTKKTTKLKKAKKVDGNVTRRKTAKAAATTSREDIERLLDQEDADLLDHGDSGGECDEENFFADMDDDIIDPLDRGEDSTPAPGDDGL